MKLIMNPHLFSLIQLHGLYDIICSLSMLELSPFKFRHIYFNMFRFDFTSTPTRVFSYYFISCGLLRLHAPVLSDNLLIPLSYYLQAFFIFSEIRRRTVYYKHALFFTFLSVLTGNIFIINCNNGFDF